MEIHFQQNDHHKFQPIQPTTQNMNSVPLNKASNFKGKTRSNNGNKKYVGVRQRPSGRWVAEIKDTTQKIRMWLGTFETAEAAARAYDEAACLLRGSNTRTNFTNPQISPNSPLASRIKNLLNKNKKAEPEKSNVNLNTPPKFSPNFSSYSTSYYNPNNIISRSPNKPELSVVFEGNYDQLGAYASFQEMMLLGHYCDITVEQDKIRESPEMLEIMPKEELMSPLIGPQLSQFEPLLTENETMISTSSCYEGNNNGGHEYHDFTHDPFDVLWDYPYLSSSFCSF